MNASSEGDIVSYLKAHNVKLSKEQFKIIKEDYEWTVSDLSEINIDNEDEINGICTELKITFPVKMKLKSAIRLLQNNRHHRRRRASTLPISSKRSISSIRPRLSTTTSCITDEYKAYDVQTRTAPKMYTRRQLVHVPDTDKELAIIDAKKVTVSLIGESGVGKTSIIARVDKDEFIPSPVPTLCYDITSKYYRILDDMYQLEIIDTAGQEQFHSVGNFLYRQTMAFLLVFDVSDEYSFDALECWIQRLDGSPAHEVAQRFIVGTKIDKVNERVISKETGRMFANGKGYRYFEMSAKSGVHVEQAFKTISLYLIKDGIVDKFDTDRGIKYSDTHKLSVSIWSNNHVINDKNEAPRQKCTCK